MTRVVLYRHLSYKFPRWNVWYCKMFLRYTCRRWKVAVRAIFYCTCVHFDRCCIVQSFHFYMGPGGQVLCSEIFYCTPAHDDRWRTMLFFIVYLCTWKFVLQWKFLLFTVRLNTCRIVKRFFVQVSTVPRVVVWKLFWYRCPWCHVFCCTNFWSTCPRWYRCPHSYASWCTQFLWRRLALAPCIGFFCAPVPDVFVFH